ncbi:MFS general substrate transporter [Meredithblackwellia eburnea MCA 4105]
MKLEGGTDDGNRERELERGKEEAPTAELEDTYPEGGWVAWKNVAASFILVGCCNGYGLVWGNLLQELHSTTHKNTPLSTLNLVAGLMNFVLSFVSFISGRLGDKYGYKRLIIVSVVSTYITFIVCSFISFSLPALFVVQGFLLGTTLGLGLPLFLALPCQYFYVRRGYATGIAASGAGFFGAIFSLIIRGLLPRLGYGRSLLVHASIAFTLSVGACFMIETRELESAKGKPRVNRTWLPTGVWRDPAFYSLNFATLVAFMGFFPVFFFITNLTVVSCPQLDPKSLLPALPLMMANLMSGFGRIFAGRVSDRIGPLNTTIASFTLGSLFQLAIWPNANTFGKIMTLGSLYGFVATWYLSLLSYTCAQLWGMKGIGAITGFELLLSAPGQMFGAQVAGEDSIKADPSPPSPLKDSGSMMLAGALSLLVARFHRERRIFTKY